MKCENCGKEYKVKNKRFCSQKCRTEFLRNHRTCIVCGSDFWTSPSSKVITCGPECEKINRSKNGRSEESMEHLKKAWEAFSQNKNTGNYDTNIHAKSYRLMSADGKVYEVNNLLKWCREHTDIIPYKNPKTFATEIGKIKAGKVKSAGGWTLIWSSENNLSREGMPKPHRSPKRTKMSEEERIERKRKRAKEYYQRKKVSDS